MVLITSVFFMYVSNIDFSTGNDRVEIQTQEIVDCEKRCASEKWCKGFVLSKVQGKCWLKDNLTGLKQINGQSIGALKVNGF